MLFSSWWSSWLTAQSFAATVHGGPSIWGRGPKVTYRNDVRFLFDTDGNQVDTYAMKINLFNGTYYLYGEGQLEGLDILSIAAEKQELIKSYTSQDLIHWEYKGTLCPEGICGGGRPHIVYNEKTKKYLLWTDNGEVGYRVTASDYPNRDFKPIPRAQLSPKYNGLKPADLTVKSLNGTGYIVHSVIDFKYPNAGSFWPFLNQSMYITKLTDDYTSTDLGGFPVRSADFDLVDNEAESPDLFYNNGNYYISTSNSCGYCNASIGLLFRSPKIEGPWTRQIISGTSCNGQVEGVLPVTDTATGQTTYVWHSTSVPGGPRVAWTGHHFAPLEFNRDGSVKELDCSPKRKFEVKHTPLPGPAPKGKILKATDGTPLIADYRPSCNSDRFSHIQTWTNTKAGTLKEVAVNVAKAHQRVPLVFTVFRFPSYEKLIAPSFRFEELGKRSVAQNSTDFLYSFGTISVSNLTAKVAPGDKLGVLIDGPDVSPYCYLEYDADEYDETIGDDTEPRLFIQGGGQTSPRGRRGEISPVYERHGTSLKFFATVE